MSGNKERTATNVILNDEEHNLLLDHDYDGIEEFNYPLPSWWVMTFIGGIVFAVAYMFYYHGAGGPSLQDEYVAEMKKVNAVRAEQAKLLSNFNESDYNAWVAANDGINKGKEVYDENCLSCHEEGGKGDIGPNLTDAYWLNVKDTSPGTLFEFVRVGNEDNGMPAWGEVISKEEMYAAVAFIKTLEGTNVEGGKEPQGEKLAQ